MGLDEFLGVLKRRWLVVAVTTGVVLVVAILLSSSGDSAVSFSASTKLLLAEGLPSEVEGYVPSLSRLVDREFRMRAQLVRSDEVAEAVAGELGYDDAKAVLDRIAVSSDDQRFEVTISAQGDTGESAAELANAYADAYSVIQRENQEEALATVLKGAEDAAERAKAAIDYIEYPSDWPASSNLFPVAVGDGAYEHFETMANRVRVAQVTQTDPVIIVTRAVASSGGVEQNTLQTGLFALFAGLALGLILAFVVDYILRGRASAQ